MATIAEGLIHFGSTPYVFPDNIDNRIPMLCRIKGIDVFEVPDLFKVNPTRHIAFLMFLRERLNGAGMFGEDPGTLMIQSFHFNGRPIEELEFAIWHEFGHLMNDDHDSESDADDFAIKQLTQVYGEVKADVTYRNWLFNEYHVDTATDSHDEMKDKDKPKYGFRLDRIASYLVNNH